MTNQRKVVRYRKRRRARLNFAIVIFGVVFLYIVICAVRAFLQPKTAFYEVVRGSSAALSNRTYTGIILRDEEVLTTQSSGYINFYVSECDRVSANDTLYSIDESGTVTEMLAEAAENADILTDADLSALQSEIYQFCSTYDPQNFHAVYQFKADLDGNLMDAVSANSIESINKRLEEQGIANTFQIVQSPKSGIVTTFIDGYETTKPEELTLEDFDLSSYTSRRIISNDLVEKGSEIGKLVRDETWTIVIPLEEEEAQTYAETSAIRVRFPSDGNSARCDFSVITNKDGSSYGVLTFYQYMIRYAAKRYIELQIVQDIEEGLKIPKTSVIDKDLYTIPKEYYIEATDTAEGGFLMEVPDEDGNLSVRLISPTIYDSDEDYYYVGKDVLSESMIVIQQDSNQRYPIGTTGTVKGCFLMNNGYTVFRKIEIIDESNEYYIVRDDTARGLVLFDHIVLNADTVEEAQIIYQ